MIETLRCNPALFEKDLKDKTYIVTGANSGVGLETTRQLVRQGAHVVMACRRVDEAKAVAEDFSGLNGSVEVMKLNLADLDSVRKFTVDFKARYTRLDALVNNAGTVVYGRTSKKTKHGFEMMFGINHLGHFLLTELLLDLLKDSAPSRVVILTSVGHAGSPRNRITLDFNDLNNDHRNFNSARVYGESKLANLLYAKELADRVEGSGVTVVSVHPGWARSNFGGPGAYAFIQNILLRPFWSRLTIMSSEDAAQTSLHCLLSKDVENHSGEFYSQNSILYMDRECRAGGWPMKSPNPNAQDMGMARTLTKISREMLGLAE